jgi:hypothetical protein
MKKITYFALFLLLVVAAACKKNAPLQHCYYTIDNQLNDSVALYFKRTNHSDNYSYRNIDSMKTLVTLQAKQTKIVRTCTYVNNIPRYPQDTVYNYYLDDFRVGKLYGVTGKGDTLQGILGSIYTRSLANSNYWRKEIDADNHSITFRLILH